MLSEQQRFYLAFVKDILPVIINTSVNKIPTLTHWPLRDLYEILER